MPQQMLRPQNLLALEEHRLCEKRARRAAEKNADGKKVGFDLPRLFVETAAYVARKPIWREIAKLYFDKGWPLVEREARRRVGIASRALARSKENEERAAARRGVDSATEFRTLADVLHRRFVDAGRIHPRSGQPAFRRAIKAAIKEVERHEKTASWQARDAIRRESLGRRVKDILLKLGPPPTRVAVTENEWKQIVIGPDGESDPGKPYDAKAMAEKYGLKGSPGNIRLANLRQRGSPVR